MKKLIVCLIYLLPFIVCAQKGTRYLTQEDPLIGNWKFNPDSSGHKSKAPILGGEEIIQLLPGLEVCMMSKSHDPVKGTILNTYFIVKKDAAKIYGSVTESDNTQWTGKDFSFQYQYKKSSDLLVVIINNKKYCYTRFLE